MKLPASVFISYSHRDEKWLDLLHKHLAMLRRERLIDVWFDRRIEAGGHINSEVSAALEGSSLFLFLVSPDFLDSHYCYEREMARALERVDAEGVRVVPVILEPCDWKSSPLSQFKALPKDGNPVSLWANANVAMLDIVTELRKLLSFDVEQVNEGKTSKSGPEKSEASRRVRVKRDFDSIDRSKFRDSSFETIRAFFESSVTEINQIGEPLKASYEEMSKTAFTCTVVNKAQRNGEASITVHNQKRALLGDITYSHSSHGEPNSANGTIDVEADDFQLYLRASDFGFRRDTERKLTAEQVARLMWDEFVERAGVEYE